MYDYLIALKQKQEDDKMFYGNSYCDSGFVCCYEDGKPLKVSYISHAFSDLLKNNDLPHIRFHDLRHSTATALLRSGVNLKVIQEILGHSTMATTANFYLHPDIEEKRKAIDKMSNILKPSAV
jgi:integrase